MRIDDFWLDFVSRTDVVTRGGSEDPTYTDDVGRTKNLRPIPFFGFSY